MSLETEPVDVLSLSAEGLEDLAEGLGQPRYRGRQLLHDLHARRLASFEQMTDLPVAFRERLAQVAVIDRPRVAKVLLSADGSRKFLFELADGRAVESVLMPQVKESVEKSVKESIKESVQVKEWVKESVKESEAEGPSEPGHLSLCVSSQVGCAMGCRFCLTGTLGLARNLTSGEIVGQVAAVQDYLATAARPRWSSPGQPGLHGHGRAAGTTSTTCGGPLVLCSPRGSNFSRRHVTVSTSGLVPGIERLAACSRRARVKLAVSLNATDRRGARRADAGQPPVADRRADGRLPALPAAAGAAHHLRVHPARRGQRHGARRPPAGPAPGGAPRKVNLIPYNENPGSGFRQPSEERILAFQQVLVNAHYTAIIRRSKGAHILAACGQLAGQGEGC